ncbi:MAG: hypothetical protein ACPG5W_02285 [Flavobacteriales bacterium]
MKKELLILLMIAGIGCAKPESKVIRVEMTKPEVVEGSFNVGVVDITDLENQVFYQSSETEELVYSEHSVSVGSEIMVSAQNRVDDYNTWCTVEIDGKQKAALQMKSGTTNQVFFTIE